MMRHLVLWKLTTDDPAEKAQIVEELTRRFAGILPVIDGAERLDIRADVATTQGNWDVVLDADYRDADALAGYIAHPAHLEVAQYVRSIISDRACIDFEV